MPTTGGLTWAVTSVSAGTCSISAAQVLSCTFGDLANGQTRTVVVTTNNAGGAPPASCTGTKLNNIATAHDAEGQNPSDTGDYTCTPKGKSFNIGPSSMEGAIIIDNGDWVNGGYSFQFKDGKHAATDVTVSANVTITGPCSNGGTGTLTVDLGTQTFHVPAGNTDWQPTGDANSVLSWQGSVIANVCGGGGSLDASKGAVFHVTAVSQNPSTGSLIAWRFKYRDPAAKNKPNTNCLNTLDPNRAKADVCGASWSQTVVDP
jgi:hypothetical protein